MKKILIAGIGNIFHGDDAFGCEVVKELKRQGMGRIGDSPVPSGHWPDGTPGTSPLEKNDRRSWDAAAVPSGGSPLGTGQWPVLPTPLAITITDFGIRSYDLAYALTDGYDATILIDATPRGKNPGTIYLIEPDLRNLHELKPAVVDPHSMNPVAVLQLAQSLGAISGKLFLVGCEPEILESENGDLGLSVAVRAAIPPAVEMVTSLIAGFYSPTETEPALTPNGASAEWNSAAQETEPSQP